MSDNPDNLPVSIAPSAPSAPSWAAIDTAPKGRAIILFCPWVATPDGTGSHPDAKIAHGRVVGWWSEKLNHWASGIPGTAEVPVYPSRWCDLLGEPV